MILHKALEEGIRHKMRIYFPNKVINPIIADRIVRDGLDDLQIWEEESGRDSSMQGHLFRSV